MAVPDGIGDDGLWMIVDRDHEGHYFPTVVVNSDTVIPLGDPTAAVQYAVAVLRAGTYAQYEAAVYGQLSATLKRNDDWPPGMVESFLADVIGRMRRERKAIKDKATAPLKFVPFMSARTEEPLVGIHLNGAEVAQVDARDAITHAVAVLQGTISADLDVLYRKVLDDTVGLPEQTTAAMVDALTGFFEDAPDRPKPDRAAAQEDM